MGLSMREHHGLVYLPRGRSVGILNSQAFEALSACSGVDSFHADVFVSQDEWVNKMKHLDGRGAATHRRNGIVMSAGLILFGPETLGDALAKSLGAHDLFLQPPYDSLTEYSYRNPQSLSLPTTHACMELDTADLGLHAALASRDVVDMENASESTQVADSTRLVNLVAGIDQFFEHVPTLSHRPITLAPQDQRMLSSLFP